MGKPHPVALRVHASRSLEEGIHTVKSVNDMVFLKHETGWVEPLSQINGGRHGKPVAKHQFYR